MNKQKLFNLNHAKAIENTKAIVGIVLFILFIGFFVR